LPQIYDTLIVNSSDIYRDMLRHERDDQVENMRNSQKNTKDDRYLEIRFKNGNVRRIKYSKKDDTYHVSFDRIGYRIDWMMFGKQMKPIVLDDEWQLIKAEVEHYKKSHPDMSPEQAAEMEKYLTDLYSQGSSNTEDESSPTCMINCQ